MIYRSDFISWKQGEHEKRRGTREKNYIHRLVKTNEKGIAYVIRETKWKVVNRG